MVKGPFGEILKTVMLSKCHIFGVKLTENLSVLLSLG